MTKIESDTPYYTYHNENPKNRKNGDCVLRAIATATCKTWDETLDGLVTIAHIFKYAPATSECYARYLESQGFLKEKMPKKFDNTRYDGKEFCDYLNKKYEEKHPPVIAHIGSHHISCFMYDEFFGYRCYDTWDPTEYKVGIYYVHVSNIVHEK